MKLKINYNYFLYSLRRYLQFQLIATIISLPILNAWGLPISFASLAGNILLAPFLSTFLLFSSFAFFFELAGIPNFFPIWGLEKISTLWYYLMEYAPTWATICLPLQPTWALLALPLITALLIEIIRPSEYLHLATCTTTLITFFIYALIHSCPTNGIIPISHHNKTILLVRHNDMNCLVDTGAIGSKKETSIEYTLVSEVRKIIGNTKINHLILTRPGIFLFDGVTQLIEHLDIEHIHLIYWNAPQNNKKICAHYWKMKRCLEKNNIKLIRFGMYTHIIKLDSKSKINITPSSGVQRRGSLSWKHLLITTEIDKVTRDLYDTSKHK